MPTSRYATRRKKLQSLLKAGIALIPSGSLQTRSNDTEFPFRQCSNFQYLTGFHEDGAMLVLCSKHKEYKSVLFVTPKNPQMEQWTGFRTGVKKAQKELGIDKVFSIEDFDKELPGLMLGHNQLYLDLFNSNDELLKKALNCAATGSKRGAKKGDIFPQSFINIMPIIGKLRLKKDASEIKEIKAAMKISHQAHLAAMAFAEAGKKEYEVQAMMEYIFAKNQGYPAYTSIVAGGDHANILHYIENNDTLKKNELLLIDAGAEYNTYASDVTRTFPISGKYSPAQAELYKLVLKAMKAAIKSVKPGKTLNAVHEKAVEVLTKGMIELKLLKGTLKKNLKDHSYRKYFPHGTSHWLGLDVHDNTPYCDENGKKISLTEGMIFSVEPGLYIPKSDKSAPAKYRGIGIRIEDVILVTNNGYENLSESIPKEIKEVEKACKEDMHKYL